MSELEDIRQRKLQELQAQMQQSNAEAQQNQLEKQQIEAYVRQHMSKEAVERFGNIKIAFPEKAEKALLIMATALQRGQIKHIDDKILKTLLEKLQSKTEFKIRG
jgi:programmed cell death protein 5